jgi:hypothetical protein
VTSPREATEHLFSCFDAVYEVMGASAPTLTNDAYVVRTYETARAMGEVALRFREYLGEFDVEPLEIVREVLLEAVAGDVEGAMVLFCFTVVIGPRLLVSLRDAREQVALDDEALEVLNFASKRLIAEMFAVGEVAKSAEPVEDEAWQERARSLGQMLDQSGNADSLGISR